MKKNIFLYVQPNHFGVQQKWPQHCKSTTLQKIKFFKMYVLDQGVTPVPKVQKTRFFPKIYYCVDAILD